MKRKKIDAVRIGAPCAKKWENMRGGVEIRFCDSCEKNVYNLSELSASTAARLLAEEKFDICVRYVRDAPAKSEAPLPKSTPIVRRGTFAASVLAFSLALAVGAAAQEDVCRPPESPIERADNAEITEKPKQKFALTGYVENAEQNGVEAAEIILVDRKTGLVQKTFSDRTGYYIFRGLDASVYEITANYAGYESGREVFEIDKAFEKNLLLSLPSQKKDVKAVLTVLKEEATTGMPDDPDELQEVLKALEKSLSGSIFGDRSMIIDAAPPAVLLFGVSGRVLDADGNKVPFAVVQLIDRDDNSFLTTIADADGFYKFEKLRRSVYKISAVDEKNGFSDESEIELFHSKEKDLFLMPVSPEN